MQEPDVRPAGEDKRATHAERGETAWWMMMMKRRRNSRHVDLTNVRMVLPGKGLMGGVAGLSREDEEHDAALQPVAGVKYRSDVYLFASSYRW